MENDKMILLISSFPSMGSARKVGTTLIKEKLAACVNIISNVSSIYEWEEKIEEKQEILTLIKTKSKNFDKVKSRIKILHSYEIPEIIAIDISNSCQDYKNWLLKSLD